MLQTNNEVSSIQIYDLNGKMVSGNYTSTLASGNNGRWCLNTAKLNDGIYFISVQTISNHVYAKLIIE